MQARAVQAAQEPQPQTGARNAGPGRRGSREWSTTSRSTPPAWHALSLEFHAPGEARVMVKYQGESLTFPVGLDGRYRRGPYGPFHLLAGAMGKWTSPNEFLLDLNLIANINHYTLRLRFEGDHSK